MILFGYSEGYAEDMSSAGGGARRAEVDFFSYFRIMNSNYFYTKYLQKYARKNREEMTKAEACLWKYALSKRQMLNQQFRRQRPIGKYIVDFVCLPLKLVIEVDGYSHQLPQNERKDSHRQKELQELGFTVVRFSDEDVLNHMNTVREIIEGWITKINSEKKP